MLPNYLRQFPCIRMKWNHLHNERSSYLSPYTLCRFRLGLPPGVMSLCLPASSKSFSALLNALGSIASLFGIPAPLSLCPLLSLFVVLSDALFTVAGGGVALWDGVSTGGVLMAFATLVMCV